MWSAGPPSSITHAAPAPGAAPRRRTRSTAPSEWPTSSNVARPSSSTSSSRSATRLLDAVPRLRVPVALAAAAQVGRRHAPAGGREPRAPLLPVVRVEAAAVEEQQVGRAGIAPAEVGERQPAAQPERSAVHPRPRGSRSTPSRGHAGRDDLAVERERPGACEKLLERDPELEPRERRADAHGGSPGRSRRGGSASAPGRAPVPLERRRVEVRRPEDEPDELAGRDVRPPSSVSAVATRRIACCGASTRTTSSTNAGISSGSARTRA